MFPRARSGRRRRTPSATTGPQVYINPVLSKPTGDLEIYEEGCLSLPDIRGDVMRPPTITITYTDIEGRQVTQAATGLLGRCWQHETDHLDGVLIIDKMTQIFPDEEQERNPRPGAGGGAEPVS